MPNNPPIVAIIGRPNVGKSCLFNRLVGKRKAIVDQESGVTRDRLYARVAWQGAHFTLVDTGGIDSQEKDGVSRRVKNQAKKAMEEANLILFICDVTSGVMPLDQEISAILHKKKGDKKILLVANKGDNERLHDQALDFYELGLGKPYPVSAMHGLGIGELLDEIARNIGSAISGAEEETIKIAIIGRPNVGKSSFLNCLLGEERVIVDHRPGTTRDAIDTYLKRDDTHLVLIDTAGIRHKAKIKQDVEIYSVGRAKQSIRRCDLSLVLIDGMQGLTKDDLRIFHLVIEEGRACFIVVNKWDLVKGIPMAEYEKAIRARARFLDFAPVVFTSALSGRNILKAVDLAVEVVKNSSQAISTSLLNKVLKEAYEGNPPPSGYGRRLKLYYATQTSRRPPTFLAFVNEPKLIKVNYTKYIENYLRKRFNLTATPIRINYRKSQSK